MYIVSMEAMHMIKEKIFRYFVGCQPRLRGGWFVGMAIEKDGRETSRFYRTDIKTKKEAKMLALTLNNELHPGYGEEGDANAADAVSRAW